MRPEAILRPRSALRRAVAHALVLAAALQTTACDFWYNRVPSPDDLWHVIPWFDHMIRARYVRPYETNAAPRYAPEGTVPITGVEPDWLPEWSTGKVATVNALKNPLAAEGRAAAPGADTPVIPREIDAVGDTVYGNYCAVCHGIAGDAKGPVSRQIGAPSLLTARARAYSDGYIYSIIRYGRGVMPRYGDKIYMPLERWAVVNHLRKLQRQTPAAAEPPGADAPIAPSPSATGSVTEGIAR